MLRFAVDAGAGRADVVIGSAAIDRVRRYLIAGAI